MSYGNCPHCGQADHKLTTRERRPNGDTTCGFCARKSPSREWAKEAMTYSAQYPWARDLYLAFHTQADNFNAQLMRLIAKADGFNRRKLAKAYPDAVLVYEAWHSSPTEAAFMSRYKVGEELRDPVDKQRFLATFGPDAARSQV